MKHRYVYLIIAGVIIIFIPVFYFAQYNATQTQAPSISDKIVKSESDLDADTADWQTYRNEEYGFEFQYPQEWSFATTVDKITLGAQNALVGPIKGIHDVGGDQIDFSVNLNSQLLPVLQWAEGEIGFEGTDSDFMITDSNGIERVGVDQISGTPSIMIMFPRDDKVFVFSTSGVSQISLLKVILSTFKFIE